jgi:hypothetical protein
MNLLTVIIAMIMVESGGNDLAVRPAHTGGDEVGCLQIKRQTVDDCNRILGRQHFTYADRYSRAKSIEMAQIYFGHYKPRTYEQAARQWNGGPQGHRKAETIKYWEKVKGRMKQ